LPADRPDRWLLAFLPDVHQLVVSTKSASDAV
jgi:hypothetical protein